MLAELGGISAVFGCMTQCLACTNGHVCLLVPVMRAAEELNIQTKSLKLSVFVSSDRRLLVACLVQR